MKKIAFPILVAGMPQSGSTLLYNIISNILGVCSMNPPLIGGDVASMCASNMISIILIEEVPLLFKTHRLELNGQVLLQNKNTKVFTTRRDIRDCVASNIRKRKKSGTYFPAMPTADGHEQLIEWLKHHETWNYNSLERAWREYIIKASTLDGLNSYMDWKERTNFEFVYESYKNGTLKNRIAIISKIAKTLNLELDGMKAKKILHFVEEVLAPASLKAPETCEETLMGPHIITNNGIVGGYKETLFSNEIEAIEEIAGDWLRERGYMK